MVVITEARGFWMRHSWCYCWQIWLTGQSRGVQRLDRKGKHNGFYLGPGLHVSLDSQLEWVGDRPLDFYLEDLENDPVNKIFCMYNMISMMHVCIKKESVSFSLHPSSLTLSPIFLAMTWTPF